MQLDNKSAQPKLVTQIEFFKYKQLQIETLISIERGYNRHWNALPSKNQSPMIIISKCYTNTSKIGRNTRITTTVDVEIEISRKFKMQLNEGFKNVKKYFWLRPKIIRL